MDFANQSINKSGCQVHVIENVVRHPFADPVTYNVRVEYLVAYPSRQINNSYPMTYKSWI